ncbi:hypothetical protein VTK73DRAFT_415 [Phialemonium thermophilum]|uniref:Uncharacterized protein n=1 Tax=Phialemonium thermophilum TaxID=223376 RepID=A0ABR3VVB6_9PEZI
MRCPPLLAVLLALRLAEATGSQRPPDAGVLAVSKLLARQDGECTIHSTCSECFGAGNIVCDHVGCFNPDAHEQCCAGAAICVAKDNSCCRDLGGPGVTGKAGAPDATPTFASTAGAPSVTSWSCTADETGEECCQKAPVPLHWCSGQFPQQRCYNSDSQFCCTDGTVCDGSGCCDLFKATTTNPYTAATTAAAADTTSVRGLRTTATPSSTPSPNAGALSRAGWRIIVLVAAGLGLILYL